MTLELKFPHMTKELHNADEVYSNIMFSCSLLWRWLCCQTIT